MIKSLSRTIVYGIIFAAFIIIFISLYKTCGAIASSIFAFDDLASSMPDNNLTPVLLNMLVVHFMPVLTVLWLRRGSNFFACLGTIIWVAVLFMLETSAAFDLVTGTPNPIFGDIEEVKNYRLLFISAVCFVSTLASSSGGMFRSLSNVSEKFGANFGKMILSFLATILVVSIVVLIAFLGTYITFISKYVALVLFVISAIMLLVAIIKSFKKQPAVAQVNNGGRVNNNNNVQNGGFGTSNNGGSHNNPVMDNFGQAFGGSNNGPVAGGFGANDQNSNNNPVVGGFGASNNGGSHNNPVMDDFGQAFGGRKENDNLNFNNPSNNNNNNVNDGFGGMNNNSHHEDGGINFGDSFGNSGHKDNDLFGNNNDNNNNNNNDFGGSKREEDDRPKF